MSIPRRESKNRKIAEAVANLRSKQAQRLILYLHERGPCMTGDIAGNLAIGNVSHAAALANEALKRHGFVIFASLPRPLSQNRFNERSMAHVWTLRALR